MYKCHDCDWLIEQINPFCSKYVLAQSVKCFWVTLFISLEAYSRRWCYFLCSFLQLTAKMEALTSADVKMIDRRHALVATATYGGYEPPCNVLFTSKFFHGKGIGLGKPASHISFYFRHNILPIKPLDTFGKQYCPKTHTWCTTTYI